MRRVLLLIVYLPCLSGCVGVWEHWIDGPGWWMGQAWSGVVKNGPEFAANTAVNSAGDALDSKLDDATAGHESMGERQQRKIDRVLDND